MLRQLEFTRRQTEQWFDPYHIFVSNPEIYLEPEESVCTCDEGDALLVQKTKSRLIVTRHLGACQIHETVKYCPLCEKVFRCKELDRFVAPGSRFGYDVLEFVGRAVWCETKTIQAIQQSLKLQNISISEREIAHLAKKFVLYIVEASKNQQPIIKRFLHRTGGYFLHFDSTHPGQGSSHLMCAVAEEVEQKIQLVLGSVKLPKESQESVAAFLRDLKEKYGEPLAGISDMLASNLAAFQEVFPLIPLLICHFHFLRDLGKDWMGYENMRLGSFLSNYDISKRLKKFAKKCKMAIEVDPLLKKCLSTGKIQDAVFKNMPPIVQAYSMVMWILDYEKELHGYGFPFDRANLVYLQRMKNIFQCLEGTKHNELGELTFLLAAILQDPALQKEMAAMEEKVEDFDHIRAIMQIAPTEGGKGLNDDGGECDMMLMEQQLKQFINSERISKHPDKAYHKMSKQILKYWGMLFTKPIEARKEDGTTELVYPQRTNNTMERFFREFQRFECKRTGMGTLSRRVQSMVAETPMMKNLSCPEFLKIILKGQATLAARFAELDAICMQEKMKKMQSLEMPPIALQKFIKNANFHKICSQTFNYFRKSA